MTVKDRLKLFLRHLDISEGKFEDITGLSSGAVSNFGDSPRQSTLKKITHKYPILNVSWLLTGDGNMLKTVGGIDNNPDLEVDHIPKLSEYIEAVKEKNRILEESKRDLKEMNDRLFAMLETSVNEIKPSLVSLSDRQHVLAAEIMAGFDRAAEIEAKGDKVKEQEKMRRVYELITERLPAHLKKGKTAVPDN